jgi:hypothetical protein
MTRIILTYGLISGLVVVTGSIGTIMASGGGAPQAAALPGYLILLVPFSAILVGVKHYRDEALCGVITFRRGLALGLGIAAVASLAYIAGWELYLAMTDYSFMDQCAAQILEAKRAAGVSGAAYQQAVAHMQAICRQYDNPLFRLPITFAAIFPVGLLIASVSAALLRNPRFLPATSWPVVA